MALRWKINFKSLRTSTLYSVNIYDDDYIQSEPVELMGAANPFVIQEDDDEDLFKPVRTQSGYIRIIDNGLDMDENPFDWKEMLALTNMSRPVTLTHVEGNTTVIDWQGFMQPQTFSGTMYENVQEREFPVQCCLSVLEGIDVSATNHGVVNFAYLLKYMFDQLWHSFEYVEFQGGTDITDYLRKQVDWQNLISFNDDTVEVKYNCMDLLENICKFFGWSCRQYSNELYFVSPDDNLYPSFGAFDYRDLSDIASGQSVRPQTYDWGTRDMSLRSYSSNENEEVMLLGTKKAKIEADINKVDNVMTIHYEELREIIERDYTVVHHPFSGFYYLFDSAHPWNNKLFLMDMLQGGGGFLGSPSHVDPWPPGAGVTLWEFDTSAHKHNYNLNMNMWWRGEPRSTSLMDCLFLIESKYEHNFDNGVIVLEATTYRQWEQNQAIQTATGQGTVTAKFAVGDNNWWNGTEWQNTETSFTFRVGDENISGEGSGKGQIICNRILDSIWDNYNGYGMQVNGSIGGKILFKVMKVELDEGDRATSTLWVDDFQIRFVRRKSDNNFSSDSKNEYKSENGSDFYGTREDSVIFASDNNNAFGYGIIMNIDDTYCQELTYTYSNGDSQEHPEQHFVNRVTAFGNSVKRLLTLDLISINTTYITPWTKCLLGGKYYYPMSFKRNWRDDITTVQLIEIPVWNNN